MQNFTDFERFYITSKNLGLAARDMDKQKKSAVYAFVRESENIISSLQLEAMDYYYALHRLLIQNQNEVRTLVAILRAHGIAPEVELGRPVSAILADEELSVSGNTIKQPTAIKDNELWKEITQSLTV